MIERFVVAVDCDDVLLPSNELIISLYNQRHGTNVQLAGAHSAQNPDWQASPEEIAERIYDIQLSHEYLRAKPFEDAIEVCERLSSIHELHVVTARPSKIMHTTLAMLNDYFPDVFTEVEHVGLRGNKGEVCQRLQADVLIDDNYKHLEAAKLYGIKNLYWFGEYPWQDGDVASGEVVRCKDWVVVEHEIGRIASRY